MITYGFVLLTITAALYGLGMLILLAALFGSDAVKQLSSGKIAIALIKSITFTALFTIFAVTFAGPQHLAMLIIGAVLYGISLIGGGLKIITKDYATGCVGFIIDLAMMVQFIVVAALI